MEWDHVFARLGGIEPVGTPDFCPVPEPELRAIEAALRVRLPEPYRAFLARYGASAFRGSSPDNPYIQFRTRDPLPDYFGTGEVLLAALYGTGPDPDDGYSLRFRMRFYSGRVPDTMIPIGDSWGSQICLGVRGESLGKVYFWDERGEPLDADSYQEDYGEPRPPEAIFQNVYLVADSFEEFLRKLEVAPEESPDPPRQASKAPGAAAPGERPEKPRRPRKRKG